MVRLGVVNRHLGRDCRRPQASRSISDTVLCAERTVSLHWLTYALAVFSWEPESTVSHLRFLWPPTAGGGGGGSFSHWVCCFRTVGSGDFKIMWRTHKIMKAGRKNGDRWAQGEEEALSLCTCIFAYSLKHPAVVRTPDWLPSTLLVCFLLLPPVVLPRGLP